MKKIIMRICSLFVFVLSVVTAQAQDIHFSQFGEAPMMLNPALTSAYSIFRASVNYKEQWKSVTVPYKTTGASFEMKLNQNAWQKENAGKINVYHHALSRVCAGLQFFSDKAGDGGLQLFQAHLSLATSVPLNYMNSLGIGLQGGYVQHSVDYSKFLFPEQFDGINYDPSLASGENYSTQKYAYADCSAGILWNHGYEQSDRTAQKKVKWTIGAALFHINQPKYSFYEIGKFSAYEKVQVHARFEISNAQQNIAFLPDAFCAWQGASKELIIGGMLRYRFKDETKYTGFVKGTYFSLGAHYRNKDAIILSTLLEFGNCGIGLSYDMNTSGLSNASNGRGGFEIAIRYSSAKPFLYQNKKTE